MDTMMDMIRDFWRNLDSGGRIAVIVAVTIVLIAAMVYGLDLSWIPQMLGAK